MTQEALKLALEWAEANGEIVFAGGGMDAVNKMNSWVTAIKEALAQPEQEPKCGAIIEVFGKDWRLEYMSLPVGKHKLYTQQYNYIAPANRTPLTDEQIEDAWVGLTDEEIKKIAKKHKWHEGNVEPHLMPVYRSLEAKLKEKNT